MFLLVIASIKDRFQSGWLCTFKIIFQAISHVQGLFRVTLSGRDLGQTKGVKGAGENRGVQTKLPAIAFFN